VLSARCDHEAVAKQNGELSHGGGPFDRTPPADAGILDRNIEQFQRRVIGGKAAVSATRECPLPAKLECPLLGTAQ
jgi:hypothetical protein